MPKNSSARRRRRTRRLQAEHPGLKYTAALRIGNNPTSTNEQPGESVTRVDADDAEDSELRPRKVSIDGVLKYWRRDDAEALGQRGLEDPTAADVIAAAETVKSQLKRLRSVGLRPVTSTGQDGRTIQVVQCEDPQEFLATVARLIGDTERVRDDADIAYVEWTTVAARTR